MRSRGNRARPDPRPPTSAPGPAPPWSRRRAERRGRRRTCAAHPGQAAQVPFLLLRQHQQHRRARPPRKGRDRPGPGPEGAAPAAARGGRRGPRGGVGLAGRAPPVRDRDLGTSGRGAAGGRRGPGAAEPPAAAARAPGGLLRHRGGFWFAKACDEPRCYAPTAPVRRRAARYRRGAPRPPSLPQVPTTAGGERWRAGAGGPSEGVPEPPPNCEGAGRNHAEKRRNRSLPATLPAARTRFHRFGTSGSNVRPNRARAAVRRLQQLERETACRAAATRLLARGFLCETAALQRRALSAQPGPALAPRRRKPAPRRPAAVSE